MMMDIGVIYIVFILLLWPFNTLKKVVSKRGIDGVTGRDPDRTW